MAPILRYLWETMHITVAHTTVFINPRVSLIENRPRNLYLRCGVRYNHSYCSGCFVFRPHRLFALLQAGGKRERFHQLQLHISVHTSFMDLRRFKRLRGLRRRDQLPG